MDDSWQAPVVDAHNEMAGEPKHLFLDYLVTKGMALHGSNRTDLPVLRPSKATGIHTDQAFTAVYATTDCLMAIFFAIIDDHMCVGFQHDRHRTSSSSITVRSSRDLG